MILSVGWFQEYVWCQMTTLEIPNVIRMHPLGTMNVCTWQSIQKLFKYFTYKLIDSLGTMPLV